MATPAHEGEIMRKTPPCLSILSLLLVLVAATATADVFDHSRFDQILKTYVDSQGLVDYNGIARDSDFSFYIQSLETAPVDRLSRDGQLAFWINAYNAVTIDKVIRRKPKRSVRETIIPGVWTSTEFFTSRQHLVAGRRMSQDHIEHQILRRQFRDPRIHFAIICASMGCPPLPRVAYTEVNVQKRLDEETREYLNSPRGTRIDRSENTLYISKLFDWFADDFVQKSGSVLAFIKPYVHEDILEFLERKPRISYLGYNWALNAQSLIQQ